MANWIDFFSLIITLSITAGIVLAILYASKLITQSLASTKESLKNRGLTIGPDGAAIKTNKRFDRSDYVDATQRGFVKAYGASSFGKDNISAGKTPQNSPSPLNAHDKKKLNILKRS